MGGECSECSSSGGRNVAYTGVACAKAGEQKGWLSSVGVLSRLAKPVAKPVAKHGRTLGQGGLGWPVPGVACPWGGLSWGGHGLAWSSFRHKKTLNKRNRHQ